MAANDDSVQNPERRTALADLIRRRREQLKLGIASFADRAVDPETGTVVKRGWIHRLETGEPVKSPEFEELRALAVAAELPVEQLQDAAGSQFHGRDPLRHGTGSSASVAYVKKIDRLPAEQRDRLFAFIDSLVPPDDADGSVPSSKGEDQ
ncbi:helix-turn-helix transcriptional regulator [Streptomyces sp. NPDC007084]|uniref:helix-turn-helix domain-containing protein n=1 Tax=Streptomyces sp. NPDC007084 TaxID=3154313 RepID=UPI003452EBE3